MWQVLKEHRSIRIPDAYADPRFDRSTDQRTGFTTRNILAVPLLRGQRVVRATHPNPSTLPSVSEHFPHMAGGRADGAQHR